MREKMHINRVRTIYGWASGYFKPKGKHEKRRIHKKLRKTPGMFRPGIMNAIGVKWEWE